MCVTLYYFRNEPLLTPYQNAWPVNFALSLDSYDEHIGGAVNLINMCLASPYAEPAAFFFSSSISSRQGAPDATCTEDFSPSPSTAAGTGYARSKWVVEKLCQRAAAKSGVPVGVLRIGQMVGDSVNGVWNETEGENEILLGLSFTHALYSLAVDVQGRQCLWRTSYHRRGRFFLFACLVLTL
jgi:UDP-glucose 4-epimerase